MRTKDITREKLLVAVAYDPETGSFTRVGKPIPNAPAGSRADLAVTKGAGAGYRRVKVFGTRFMAHRMAWLAFYGQLPSGDIDHINGDPGDNRIANLRDVPHAVNMQNRRKCSSNSQTGLLGVHASKGKFVACISHQGKTLKLGSFGNPEEAHRAYLLKKRSLHHEGCTI